MALYISQGLRSLFDIYTVSPMHRVLCLLLAELSFLGSDCTLTTIDMFGRS